MNTVRVRPSEATISPVLKPRRRSRYLDALITLIVVSLVGLFGWTMHIGRGGGLDLIAIGRDGGNTTEAVTVRSDFPKMTLSIPIQQVTAPIDREIVGTDGYLGIPADIHRVGWYVDAGQLDGGPGSVLIDGHINWVGQGTGALGNIGELHEGDVVITRGEGRPQAWRVIKLVSYLKSGGLPEDIFRKTGPRVLTLITCGGVLDVNSGNYNANIVVQAQPVTTLLK